MQHFRPAADDHFVRKFLALVALLASVASAAAQNTFFAASPGDMIYRGPTGWAPVPGAALAGQLLISNGPTAQPSWTFDLSAVSQLRLPFMTTNSVLGNVSGGSASPVPVTQTQFLDTLGYDIVRPPTIGSIPMKFGAFGGTWQALQPGPAGFVLQSNGIGRDLTWAVNAGIATPSGAGLCLVSTGPTTPSVYAVCPITSANLTATAPLALSYGTPTNLALTGVVDVPHGGTGVATITANGVVVGQGTSPVVTKSGADGTALMSIGGVPTFTATPSIATSLTAPTINSTTGNITTLNASTVFATGNINSNASMTASTSMVAPLGAFATSTTSPIVYGGSGVGSTLALRPTSGAGSGGARVNIQGGTNGALQLAEFSGNSASSSFSLGASGSIAGQILLNGNTSGAVTIKPQAAAGNWQLILPTVPGLNNQVLTSSGGGATTWATPTTTTTTSLNPNFINGALQVSAAGSALTIAVKTQAGADPSGGDPVTAIFRNVTGTTGTATPLSLTAANSITVTSGSTLGLASSTAFRLWIVGFNDGGTFRLGVWNGLETPSLNLFSLIEGITSATAEGGAGGADTAGVLYSTATVTSKAMMILGYAEWSPTGVTAGTWTTTNLIAVQMLTPGVRKPGEVVRSYSRIDTGTTVAPNASFVATGLAQTTALSSAANFWIINASGNLGNGTATTASDAYTRLFRDSTPIGNTAIIFANASGVPLNLGVQNLAVDFPNSAAAVTYAIYVGGNASFAVSWNPLGFNTVMTLQEIMR